MPLTVLCTCLWTILLCINFQSGKITCNFLEIQ